MPREENSSTVGSKSVVETLYHVKNVLSTLYDHFWVLLFLKSSNVDYIFYCEWCAVLSSGVGSHFCPTSADILIAEIEEARLTGAIYFPPELFSKCFCVLVHVLICVLVPFCDNTDYCRINPNSSKCAFWYSSLQFHVFTCRFLFCFCFVVFLYLRCIEECVFEWSGLAPLNLKFSDATR